MSDHSTTHDAPGPPARNRARLAGLAIGALLGLAYFASGVYNVAPTQRGVVRFCGRLVEPDVPPGMHFAWPWPLGRVDLPRATEVRRVVIGITPEERLLIEQGDVPAITSSPQTDVLTGDINILKATLVVQYQIRDPARYVLKTVAPDDLVRRAAEAAMAETLARMPVDEAITTGKTVLRDRTIQRTREMLDAYETGVTVVSASVQKIDPPNAVSTAFNDVTSAEYDRERSRQRAHTAADVTVRNARAEADKRRAAARDDATRRMAQARGETAAFGKRLAEYEKSPYITRERLWLNTMEQVLARSRKFIVDEKPGDGPIQLKLMDAGAAPPAK